MQRRRPVILCIDDYESTLLGWKMVLESAGYEVVAASDYRKGLQLFMSRAVDEVVLDYEMPGMTGDVLAARMKQTQPDIRILLLSGDSSLPNDKLKNVDAFLPKAEGVDVFLASVKALLPRPAASLAASPSDDFASTATVAESNPPKAA